MAEQRRGRRPRRVIPKSTLGCGPSLRSTAAHSSGSCCPVPRSARWPIPRRRRPSIYRVSPSRRRRLW